MSDEERTGSCIICASRDPLPDLAPCCGPCRSRLSGQLRDIPILCDELRGEVLADLSQGQERIEEKADHLVALLGEHHGERLAAVVQVAHFHVLEVIAGAVPGQSGAPRVRGSREAPVPVSVDRLDLLGPADERTVHDQFGDQIGHQSAATILDGWCRMFAEERRESTPNPKPADQSKWLLDRLDELFKHPAVDECAKEISDLTFALRRAAGLTEPRPELVEGVPCRSIACDLKNLWRLPGAEWVECRSCSNLLSEAELQEWIKMLRAPLCGRRNGDWYCALSKKHDGDCEPYEREEATA